MPRGVYFNDVLKTLLTIEGVQQVQNLRLWMLSLDKIALSAHLTISEPNKYWLYDYFRDQSFLDRL